MKTSNQIRAAFLDFFKSKGHEVIASSPLVPGNDATLLFTNAGMVQFKDVFLGADKRSYKTAVSSQRCVRAGGKHNDLDQVGYTARHHTFFEMLGNFSFGDYFKRDAIFYAWELLTKVYGLPAEKLWITVYHTDDEAYALWNKDIGVPAERIVRIGDKPGGGSDNFWQMADTGPCGPCSEIFYDHGAEIAGGPPGSPDEDGDRYIEIWNLVFMQFDRAADGSLAPLPAPCVDTGMGLERLCAVLQHVHSNYEIDLFQALIKHAAELTSTEDHDNKSLRVIADHIRAASFLIVDGVLPSNEGRGYVLRRIIRRGLRHGYMLGMRDLFFHKLVDTLAEQMGDAYPELRKKQSTVIAALRAEEERFAETLDQGMRIFDEVAAKSPKQIAGEAAFKLYDTYGFPVDLTADMARERGLSVDMEGFDAAMNAQRERARAASQFGGAAMLAADAVKDLPPTQFLGYQNHQADGLKVVGLFRDGQAIKLANAGESVVVVLDKTPFYAESGGQVGDTGTLIRDGVVIDVQDTLKLAGTFHGHVAAISKGKLEVGDLLSATIDTQRRSAVVLNHSATHLLHAVLRDVLGEHVQQKGSLVAPDRLRFDFAHFQPVSAEQIAQIETMVNAQVRSNAEAITREMPYNDAIAFGAMALFGEKYGEHVRVLKLGEHSTELCGGTHVERTGDIGVFKIISEGGVASGVRRIEALTGKTALDWMAQRESVLGEVGRLLTAGADDVVGKLKQLFDKQKLLERELESLKSKAAVSALDEVLNQALEINGFKVLAVRVDSLDAKGLREGIDSIKQKFPDSAVLLASGAEGKVALVAGVSGTALNSVKAGDLLSHVAKQINGKGGGRADMAQGGGEDSPQLASALAGVPDWIRQRTL